MKHALLALTAALGAAPLHAAQSDAYPSKPVRIIVAFAPGGNIDITARTIAPSLSEFLGQTVIVDNRGGAGGRIGSTLAAKSPPDGYTMLLGASGTLAVQPAFHDDLEYQPFRDFVFTSLISIVPGVLVVHPSVPAKTVKDVIAIAKARPGSLLMGSAGVGSNVHLTGELFQSMAKIKFTHVPFKGSGAALVDLVGGQVHLMFDQISSGAHHIRAGKLRPIAVTTLTRSKFLPDTPTIDESGLKGFESSTYTTLAIPAATPKDAVQKLRDGVLKAVAQPKVREAFEKLGAEVVKSTPDDLVARLKADHAKWVRIRKETGIKVE
ncbi:MAG TPA: tripartite tricarboxylate transporter substrate binding protein [Burkholderiales bacterium]|nr:tripartite tricarboxylate transporter substrate binding protein [Burkholderiales bacterium]